jgi:hypothetical protein
LSRHVGRAASSDDSCHLIAPQIFCALSRYGVIRFDRSSYLTMDKNHNTDQDRPSPMAGRPIRPCVAPVCIRHPFGQRLLPEDVQFIRTFESVSVLPWIEEVPLGANFVLGCSVPICLFRCMLMQLKARFQFTVDFPRRCPSSPTLSVPLRSEESAVISRCLKSRYRDSAPSLTAKVPNRGVDWSSRPRRACYPWGNFSVTSSPQQ